MKNKHLRPTKGQVPDPTYSRMKFAFCTDRADSDGRGKGKKKPRVEKQGLGKGFYSFFLSLSLSPHTEKQGLWNKCMEVTTPKSKKIIAVNHHTSYICTMKKAICWWSGGITSAVACKLAIDMFGLDNCEIVMIDTKNEHPDTYRFKEDCERWYGKGIETISAIGSKYDSIQDVWMHHKSLNVASGAICSTMLKRRVREKYQKTVEYDYQVFGFEFEKKEFNRANSLKMNHPNAKAIYPLLMFGYDKDRCIKIVQDAGIEIPVMYKMGFRNNNCFGTGCVQGGIGYWQKMKRDFPDKFDAMADMEWKLTEMKGEPVTMLKDQGKDAKSSGNVLVFLKKHPDYPHLKCLDDIEGRDVEPLFECNGFCGTNDLNERTNTEQEINYGLFAGL